MGNLALCKCGVDMTEHGYDDWDDNIFDHPFTAAGTKYRCERPLTSGFLCARPRYHEEDGIGCGAIMYHLPKEN